MPTWGQIRLTNPDVGCFAADRGEVLKYDAKRGTTTATGWLIEAAGESKTKHAMPPTSRDAAS